MTKVPYKPSPVGVAIHPWVNKPDTKFNADGVYQTGLAVEGEDAVKFREELDAAAKAAFEEETANMTPVERKKWSVFVPYSVEEDEDGKPTGRTIFRFRQNAILRLPDGETKRIRIGIYDSADRATEAEVWTGARIRVRYRPRNVKIASTKKAGVRLDFLKVQIVQLADRSASGGGFGAVEGGYVEANDYEGFDPGEDTRIGTDGPKGPHSSAGPAPVPVKGTNEGDF
jgi:hypothetical protein